MQSHVTQESHGIA